MSREVVLPPVNLEPEELARRLVAHMPKPPYKVIAHRADKPLKIGEIEIPCFVLENEQRVLSQRGVATSIGGSEGSSTSDAAEIPRFIRGKWLLPFIDEDLSMRLKSPIPFTAPSSGKVVRGYSAKILPQLCSAISKAARSGATTSRQRGIVERAEVIRDGLATVGIVALVDEATGYQRIREENALAEILKKYLSDLLHPWTRTFPYEFYELLYELRGWGKPSLEGKHGNAVARDTVDLVYTRLAPGVYEELRQRTPRLETGELKWRLHRWFTPQYGHPRLREHIAGVMALMRSSRDWSDFKSRLGRAYPKFHDPRQFALDLEQDPQPDILGI